VLITAHLGPVEVLDTERQGSTTGADQDNRTVRLDPIQDRGKIGDETLERSTPRVVDLAAKPARS